MRANLAIRVGADLIVLSVDGSGPEQLQITLLLLAALSCQRDAGILIGERVEGFLPVLDGELILEQDETFAVGSRLTAKGIQQHGLIRLEQRREELRHLRLVIFEQGRIGTDSLD